MGKLKIIFLGTSSAIPTKERGLTSIAVRRENELILFDAGEGTQKALTYARLGLNKPTKILISHLHGDHCLGVLGLLQTMSMAGRDKPLTSYGPPKFASFIKSSIRYLAFGLTFDLTIHNVKDGIVVEEDEYTIFACKAEHNRTNYAYVIEEKPRPGIFYAEKAQKLGIPKGKLWSNLQHGAKVTFKGKTFTPDQVVGPRRKGLKIGYSGDTRTNAKLVKFFTGCDILIFDSTYSDIHREKAKENAHSTAKDAATLAKAAGVKRLILTHFSARYDEVDQLVREASEIHSNVLAAEDLMELELPYHD